MRNATLADDVRKELLWDSRVVDPGEIAVSAEGGTVTLRGTVGSLMQRRAARKAAQRVLGVVAVDDELEVRLLTVDQRDDAELRGAVLQSLMSSVSVPSGRVDVKVSYGLVTLKGDVDFPYQSEAAEEIAIGTTGVVAVTNEIAVRSSTSEADVLSDGIRDALVRNAQTDAGRITVHVQNGDVTLSGRVMSWAEHDEAVAAASAARGVRRVDDQLIISD
jgi:osmotically-inducible protein OsmY